MQTTLQNRVAVVTGASKGIGAGIARALAAAGAAVVVNYAGDRDGADRVVHAIADVGGRAIAVQANVSRAEDVRRLMQETVAAFGPVDVLVNNAGVYQAMPVQDFTEAEFHREFDVNVLGPLLTIREALPHFSERGGSVINIGSAASRMCPPQYAIYSATKAALDAVTQVLAKELASRRIRVNSVNPGATLSEGTQSAGLYGVGSAVEQHLIAVTPAGRVGTPADIAPIVAFLASDESAWLTGEILIASGGLR
jgi:3-oxoacyl-[acyl-carrier protein] reductase